MPFFWGLCEYVFTSICPPLPPVAGPPPFSAFSVFFVGFLPFRGLKYTQKRKDVV